VHTKDTAPAGSNPLLEQVERAYRFVPNLAATLAEAPAALDAYLAVAAAFSKSSLCATEQQVVLLSVSVENECHYCVAAHSAIAAAQKVSTDAVEALRNGAPLGDPKLEALRTFTRAVVRQRG
jgi:AhpD family alkylhydroperoxidase